MTIKSNGPNATSSWGSSYAARWQKLEKRFRKVEEFSIHPVSHVLLTNKILGLRDTCFEQQSIHVLQKLSKLLDSYLFVFFFLYSSMSGIHIWNAVRENARMNATWWKEVKCTTRYPYLLKYGILVVTVCHLIPYVEHSIMDSQEEHIFSDSVIKEGTPFQLRYKVVWIKNK